MLLDQRHGLVDRFLITFSKCLRLTPQQTSQAAETLKECTLSSCEDIFIEIVRLHSSRSTYTLTEGATSSIHSVNEESIAEIYDAITEGRT